MCEATFDPYCEDFFGAVATRTSKKKKAIGLISKKKTLHLHKRAIFFSLWTWIWLLGIHLKES